MSISRSALIVRLDAIGDALTTVPLIEALRRYGMSVGAVLQAANAGIFSTRCLDGVHICGSDDLVDQIRARRYDYALIATEKPLGYRIARSARIPVRIGFQNGPRKPFKSLWIRSMCTHAVFRAAGRDSRNEHECETIFRLVSPLLPYALPSRDACALRPLVLNEMPPREERVVLQLTDKWERLGARSEHVAELVARVAARRSIRLVGSERERAYCERIAAASDLPVDVFQRLEDWKNGIAAASAVVAPDSGAIHVAGTVGTPVVACFADNGFAQQSVRWAPWASPYRPVQIQGRHWPLVAADALELLLTGNPRSAYKG